MNALRIAWAHLVARFHEKSTYVSIGGAIAGGATLPSPFSWLVVIAGVAGVLIPTS